MSVRFWGTRGSIPAPGASTSRHGGNTSCVELRCSDELFIIDSGTGIRELGDALLKEFFGRPLQARLFVTHLHWDHIQGFPFFVPAYLPTTALKIYGPHGAEKSFEEMFKTLTEISHFPVDFGDMSRSIEFVEVKGKPLPCGPVTVTSTFTNHPGMNVAYRFASSGKSVVYLTDHENYATMNNPTDFAHRQDAAIANFCRGADLLIADAQYTDEEYAKKRTWGHSRVRDAVLLGLEAGVKRLALFHHDPSHSDEKLDVMLAEAHDVIKRDGRPLECLMAAEGARLEI